MINRAQIDILDADETAIDTEVEAVSVSYTEDDSDAGAFELVLPDTVTLPNDSDVLVRVTLNGSTVDYTGRAELTTKVVKGLTPDRQVITLKGRDWVCEFDDAPVLPPMGVGNKPAARVVRFDWTHPFLDVSEWNVPFYLGSLFTSNIDPFGDAADPPPMAKVGYNPQGWPDVLTGWIWSSDVNENFSHEPGDVSYFDLAVFCQAGPLIPIFTADDTGALAIDGVEIDPGIEPPGVQWTQAYASGIASVSTGVHRIRVKAQNTEFDGQAGFYNPGAIALTLYQQVTSTYFEFTNVIARTGKNVSSPDPLQGGGWVALASPAAAPGFTWGHAFRLLFEIAQGQGHLTGWSLGFTDQVDSAGNPWSVSSEITATVGDSLLAFLRQSNARGFCDFAARPNQRILDAWRWQERGTFWSSPEVPPVWDDDNLSELSATRRR